MYEDAIKAHAEWYHVAAVKWRDVVRSIALRGSPGRLVYAALIGAPGDCWCAVYDPVRGSGVMPPHGLVGDGVNAIASHYARVLLAVNRPDEWLVCADADYRDIGADALADTIIAIATHRRSAGTKPVLVATSPMRRLIVARDRHRVMAIDCGRERSTAWEAVTWTWCPSDGVQRWLADRLAWVIGG